MASLALGVAGAAIGSYFGPLGASIGWMLGSALGSALDPQKIEGPRLGDLRLHTSSYGVMTPQLWGTMRTAGNIIDEQPELTEHSQKSGGKGGPEVTNYTYTASFAVRICKGPIMGFTRIWANGRTIYDAREGSIGVGADLPITVYLGDEEQLPDPTLEAIHGVGEVPAYRGIAYVVFTDLLLTDFGNAIPNLEFEVATKGHTNGAIRVLYENLSEGFTFHENDLDLYPVIDDWPLNTGTVLIGEVPFSAYALAPTTTVGTLQNFNATPDLDYIEEDGAMLSPYPWAVDTGSGYVNYSPIGMHKLGTDVDAGVIPLWVSPFSIVSSSSTLRPNVGGQDMIGGGGNWSGISYGALFGIPDGEVVLCAAQSVDHRRLLLFTATTTFASTASKWYEVIGSEVVRNGTISPALSPSALGHPLPLTVSRTMCNSFELGGRFLWVVSALNAGGRVNVYEIDPVTNNLAQNTVCGTFNLAAHVLDANRTGAAYSMEDGYCGFAGGDNLIVFTRFPEGETLTVPLSEIVGDVSELCGLDPAEFDVTALTDLVDGYIVAQQGAGRDWIQFLRNAYFFDGVESDDVVKFVKRGQRAAVTIDDDDLAAHDQGSEAPPILATVRTDDVQLPAIINVNHVNAEADYQTGTQRARRQVTNSASEITLDLPISMTSQKARAVAETQLYMAEVERNRHTFFTAREFAKYEPTDVVTVQNKAIRIVEKSEVRAGMVKFDGVASLAEVVIRSMPAAPIIGWTPSPPTPSDKGDTEAVLFDLPLIEDTDTPDGLYVGLRGDSPWPGGTLFKSNDGGSTYPDTVASTSTAAVLGTTSNAIGNHGGGNVFDEANVITVVLGAGQELASATELAVLNGSNEAVLGDEIIGFKNAELVDTDTYEVSGLLRGRRGTEWAMAGHASGEHFALLPLIRGPSPLADLYQLRAYKAVTFGKTLASADAQNFTNTGIAFEPYAPVLLGGGIDGSGNVTLNWTRRTRIGGEWAPFTDVPLGEAAEHYVVQIWNAAYSKVARIIETTTATASYTSAQQVTDFGAQQQHVYFSVGQLGSIGIGRQARGTAPGAGASDVDPLAPIPPYASPTSGGSTPPPPFDAINMTITWGALGSGNVRVNSASYGAFACSKVLVTAFTTPSSTAVNQIGRIGAVESVDGPVARTACLSRVAGDFSGADLGPGSLVQSSSVTVQFSVGSNTLGRLQLATSTTYYLNIKNDDGHGVCTCFTGNCSMFVELAKPHGL